MPRNAARPASGNTASVSATTRRRNRAPCLIASSSAEKIQNPTLVLCGALDQTTPPTLARALAGRIPGAYYEEIPGSGHCPMLEQPDALLAKMGEFLAGRPH